MSRLGAAAAGGLLALAACVPDENSARAPRYTLVIGIDVSGSFQNSGSYDDALSFAAHYLDDVDHCGAYAADPAWYVGIVCDAFDRMLR